MPVEERNALRECPRNHARIGRDETTWHTIQVSSCILSATAAARFTQTTQLKTSEMPTTTNSGGASVFIDLNEEEDDFSARFYARGGLEFEFANGFTLGASARYADHRFDFGSSGELELDEVQWFLTLGSRL